MALTTGLQGYYPLNEGSGTTTADSSGNGNNGTWGGTLGNQWVIGKVGTAGNFNGSNNYVVCGTYDLGNIWSLSVWIYCVGTQGSAQTIVCKRDSFSSSGMMWQLYLQPNTFGVRVITAAGIASNTMANVSQNTWAHLVYTHAGTADAQNRLSVNGVFQNTAGLTMNDGTGTGARVQIGADSFPARAEFFNGRIDEVGLWNRVLDAGEIAALYNRGNGLEYPFTTYSTLYYKHQNEVEALSRKTGVATYRETDQKNILYGGVAKRGDEIAYLNSRNADAAGVNRYASDAWVKFGEANGASGNNRAEQVEREFYQQGNY